MDKYNAEATSFLIGNEIVEHSEEAKKISQAGHQIGNHNYSHIRMVFKTPSKIKKKFLFIRLLEAS